MTLSKSQIDRLGDRLKSGSPTEADRELLDTYRSSLFNAYEQVLGGIRERLQLRIRGRERKTTQSIIEKLRREPSMKLSQMQDIAGCRVLVANVIDQDRVVERIRELFAPRVKEYDRRRTPSHGYRAVHLVVRANQLPIEVQVRTGLQHRWAALSEKLADQFDDQSIKYGGGPEGVRDLLTRLSKELETFEDYQSRMIRELAAVAALVDKTVKTDEDAERLRAFTDMATDIARRGAELRKEFDFFVQVGANKRPLH